MMQNYEDCEDLPGSSRKWNCTHCTFSNWPSATKCTMCRANRTLGGGSGQDIYSLDAPKQPALCDIYSIDRLSLKSPDLDAKGKTNTDLSGKWACHLCTYHNFSRAVRCTQCCTPRNKSSPAVSRNSPRTSPVPSSSPVPAMAHGGAGTGTLSPPQPQTGGGSLPTPPTTASTTTSSASMGSGGSSVLTATTLVNRANVIRSMGGVEAKNLQPLHISLLSAIRPETSSCDSVSPGQISCQSKWCCLVCTYENWPRSGHCVLCGVKRGRTTPDHLQSVAVSRDSPSPEGASMQKISSDSTSSTGGSGEHNYKQRHNQGSQLPNRQSGVNTTDFRRMAISNELQSQAVNEKAVEGGVGASAGSSSNNTNLQYEKRMRQIRRRMRETDWAWISACMGVVEGDAGPVEAYLNSGGDPTRKLTQSEVSLLSRPGVYEAGHTLVHLAVKLGREDLLATLLSQMENLTSPPVKRVPSYVAPDLASAIRRHLALTLRQRKGSFPCFYLSEHATYTLPPEIDDLPTNIQDQMYNELLDKDAKVELESELCINWSEEISQALGSRLYPLWNRSAGDCLLDAALQATWGVFDRDNMLRRALADSLTEAGNIFYPRWKEWESLQAQELHFSLAESQWAADWADLLSLAGQPGSSLEQLHIFCLAHVLRRPIIVYGVKYVKSWRGENLGYARFEGVYLPLLWDPGFCYRSPIALGYTRGHFCALVPPEPDCGLGMGNNVGHAGGAAIGAALPLPMRNPSAVKCNYLPLVGREGGLLPLHFLARGERGREEEILRQWLDVGCTESGIMVAQQTVSRPPLLVAQMTEEWLNYYRKIAQSHCTAMPGRHAITARILLESSEESNDDD